MEKNKKESTPAGYYHSIKDWISAMKLDEKTLLSKVYSSDPVYLSEPKGLEIPAHWNLRSSSAPKTRRALVALLPEGRVCRLNCNIITPDHKLVWECSYEKNKKPNEHSIFSESLLPAVQATSETVAVLHHNQSQVYYHWMLDVLPRLHLLNKCRLIPDKYIISGKKVAPFHYQTLEYLGIPKDKVIESHNHMHIEAKKLIVPLLTKTANHSEWECSFLKEELMLKKGIKPVQGFERIYISRANAKKRRVINETEVLSILEKFGFRSITCESLTIAEQIQIFASAKAVVGPHGSGMTNLIFSNPGTKIIEFFSPSVVRKCFANLSSTLGHEHYYVIGQGEKPAEYAPPAETNIDFTVNPIDIYKILKLASIK